MKNKLAAIYAVIACAAFSFGLLVGMTFEMEVRAICPPFISHGSFKLQQVLEPVLWEKRQSVHGTWSQPRLCWPEKRSVWVILDPPESE